MTDYIRQHCIFSLHNFGLNSPIQHIHPVTQKSHVTIMWTRNDKAKFGVFRRPLDMKGSETTSTTHISETMNWQSHSHRAIAFSPKRKGALSEIVRWAHNSKIGKSKQEILTTTMPWQASSQQKHLNAAALTYGNFISPILHVSFTVAAKAGHRKDWIRCWSLRPRF